MRECYIWDTCHPISAAAATSLQYTVDVSHGSIYFLVLVSQHRSRLEAGKEWNGVERVRNGIEMGKEAHQRPGSVAVGVLSWPQSFLDPLRLMLAKLLLQFQVDLVPGTPTGKEIIVSLPTDLQAFTRGMQSVLR